jgi:site-specific DNA-methyltransferase (adenine-specific)
MKELPENSIDFILTDLPYGKTKHNWDNIIPSNLMWEQIKRIRKDNTAIALFGTEPFSSHLRLSNLSEYKYDWIWNKSIVTHFVHSHKRPLGIYEIISIFYNKLPTYNPQNLKLINKKTTLPNNKGILYENNNKKRTATIQKFTNYPKNILIYPDEKKYHFSQKPLALLEYLIKTYTFENETVLDFTMGSGSTGIAAINTNRDFIGIELDREYYKIAKKRLMNDR